MKKTRNMPKSLFSIWGCFLFFVLIAGVATCSILAYSYILERSGGNKIVTAFLTLAVLLILTLICTVIDVLRRKLTMQRPLQNILHATECVTNGDFSIQMQHHHAFGRYNEFDLIIENINRMTAELSKNEILKTDFISNVSHEIKTPLALIQSYATALCNETLDKEQQNNYCLTLLQSTRRLSNLITNILQLSKLENQEIFPQKTQLALGEHLRECILAFEENFEQKSLVLDCDINDVNAVTDRGLLEIIWNNLISNAIKFTNEGGNISIKLREEKNHAVVTVSDTGVGIPNEIGEKIFDKFFQADTSHACEGNGLGLALVKRVIDILGGEIEVMSRNGEGSTFTIKIRKNEI